MQKKLHDHTSELLEHEANISLRLKTLQKNTPDVVFSESFIDSAISNKYNGQAGEKELQPWDGEISMDSGALEAIDSPSAADNSVRNL